MTSTQEVLAQAEARATHDPGFTEILAALIDTPLESAGDYATVAARQLRQRRRHDAIETFKKGALTTAEVRRGLHLGTPQAVHRLRSRGRLIGRQIGNSTWFPAWQFDLSGQLRADLPELLEKLGRFTSDAVAADRIMRLERDDLHGLSIAAALDRPALATTAWTALDGLDA